MLYTTTFMFTDLEFIHIRICYGFLNENNHHKYSILFVTIDQSICTRKVLVHSILISEVINMKNEVLQALKRPIYKKIN